MKTHTRWIAVYTGVVLFLAVITGFGLEQGNTSSSQAHNFLSGLESESITSTIYEPDEELVRMEDLDYLMRMDLGYPQINGVLDSYEKTIRRYANRYGFDWRLILAVMNQESRFRTQAVSHRGAFGLMQIMPATGREVSSELGMDGYTLPEDNIAGGVYYLWRMQTLFDPGKVEDIDEEQRKFDRLRLALAAYNGGPSRVRDAQQIALFLNLDPYRWEIIRDILPMLSRRYATLHSQIWPSGRPSGGYFEGFNETLNYVERTIEYYAYYRQMYE